MQMDSSAERNRRLEQEGEMKDETKYEVQSYDDHIGDWDTADSGIKSKKEARLFVRDCKDFDKEHGLKLKYRIVKLTIKKEIIK
jgi:hypothetical protein